MIFLLLIFLLSFRRFTLLPELVFVGAGDERLVPSTFENDDMDIVRVGKHIQYLVQTQSHLY